MKVCGYALRNWVDFLAVREVYFHVLAPPKLPVNSPVRCIQGRFSANVEPLAFEDRVGHEPLLPLGPMSGQDAA